MNHEWKSVNLIYKMINMKKLLYLSAFLIASGSTLNAQNSRHEIGIGVGPVQFYHQNTKLNAVPKSQSKAERSRVSSAFADQTLRKQGISSPALYYQYRYNQKLQLRAGFSYYRETRMASPEQTQIASYSGKFDQFRLQTGLSYFLSNCECMTTYIAADMTHYFERANEQMITVSGEGAQQRLSTARNNSNAYSVGIAPAWGFRKQLCPQFSFSYELGAELKYNAGNSGNFNMICMPMSRLSVNYRL
jgi:hypothetical protein